LSALIQWLLSAVASKAHAQAAALAPSVRRLTMSAHARASATLCVMNDTPYLRAGACTAHDGAVLSDEAGM
jgi:hypothetical protein